MGQKSDLRKWQCFFLFLSLLISSFILSPAASAQEGAKETQDPSSAFLLDLGEKAYSKGRTQEAIGEFSKALMMDPTNEQAKKRLKDLGVKEEALLAIHPQSVSLADLSEQINVNEGQIQQLQEEKNYLGEELKKLQEENNRLAQEKIDQGVKEQALKQKKQPPENVVINVLEDYLDVREKNLEEVQKKLAAVEAELNNKNSLIEEQQKHLKGLQEQLKESQTVPQNVTDENENVSPKE